MHAIRVIMATDPQTHKPIHKQTGSITIHCTTKLSMQCNESTHHGRDTTLKLQLFGHVCRTDDKQLIETVIADIAEGKKPVVDLHDNVAMMWWSNVDAHCMRQ